MAQLVKIEHNVATQTIIIDNADLPNKGQLLRDLGLDGTWVHSDTATVGDVYENGHFTPPEPEPQPIPIPVSVTRRQGRLALLQAGKLEAVEQAVSEAGLAAQINYEAETWDRDNALLVQLWTDLGGTETELDELFILAAGL